MKRLPNTGSIAALIFTILAVSILSATPPVIALEPSLTEIFNHLGFPNVAEVAISTFPQGAYNITLYAEFAALYDTENELSYYPKDTSIFTTIFTGPEGNFGYSSPPLTKACNCENQFGFSLFAYAHGYRYFTETSRNHDGEYHAKVYQNLDEPGMFLVGFDDRSYCDGTGDKDYNDMVFSIRQRHYLTVASPYDTPMGEGWYFNGTNAFASLQENIVNHGNGTRRIFSHWGGDAYGTNYSRSSAICMTENKTAIAYWASQHYLTVRNDPADLSIAPPPSDWYDEDVNVTLAAPTENFRDSTKYLFDHWEVDGASLGSNVNPIEVHMNRPHVATACYQLAMYTLLVLPSTGGTTIPEAGSYTYVEGTEVSVGATSNVGYEFDHWLLDGSDAGSLNPITVLMNSNHTLQAIFNLQLAVSIDPLSASILVGDSVLLTSATDGGKPPYAYQWYLDDSLVSGATSSIWAFTPAKSGIYYVSLRVTDATFNVAESETAKITVKGGPVGGFSVSLAKLDRKGATFGYTIAIGFLTAIFALIQRKTRRCSRE